MIKGGAFADSMLSRIQLPSSLKAIDVFAFSSCKALTVATLPEGLLEIGRQAFSGCSALVTVGYPRVRSFHRGRGIHGMHPDDEPAGCSRQPTL